MGKITMTGTMTPAEGKADEMAEVLVRMVDAAREEPGTEVYSYHRAQDDTFVFFAVMTDQDAMQAHGQTDAMKAAMADIGPLMGGPPQMSMATPVAGIGLDL